MATHSIPGRIPPIRTATYLRFIKQPAAAGLAQGLASTKRADRDIMPPTDTPKPQGGQAMTADEREEAQLARALELLNVLHVWVRTAHSSHTHPHPLIPMQGFRTSGYDPKNDRTADNSAKP